MKWNTTRGTSAQAKFILLSWFSVASAAVQKVVVKKRKNYLLPHHKCKRLARNAGTPQLYTVVPSILDHAVDRSSVCYNRRHEPRVDIKRMQIRKASNTTRAGRSW
jgi:hypothetical protein